MRVAVFADIHGNLEALEAVSQDLKGRDIERVVCLGDLIGYGPDPDQVVDFVRSNNYEAVLGNHEFALKDLRGRRWLNFLAAENNEASEALLSPGNLTYCCSLAAKLTLGEALFVHGYPEANVFRYLNRQSDEKIRELFGKSSHRFFFVGHTHRLQYVTFRGNEIQRTIPAKEPLELDLFDKVIVNCGSVGQPRDPDNRAKYVIWDSHGKTVAVRRVAYHWQKTMDKIYSRGFPKSYALRLAPAKK